jgi:hypothetical protein
VFGTWKKRTGTVLGIKGGREMIRECGTCKHWAVPMKEEPCRLCIYEGTWTEGHFPNWEPEEEEE